MKSECLPFTQIPHSTQLFTDFLSYQSKVRQFYPHSPFLTEWLKAEASVIKYDSQRRERVAAILERQNQAWGASSVVTKNIARLRAGALAVVTGQQVGLFGGPSFSIYKALTAVKLAAIATENGVDSVPIFWLATEDHDLAEVNHLFVPDADATLQKLETTTHGLLDAPVGAIKFGDEIEAVIESAAKLLGDSELLTALRESYRPGETFGSAFGRLFARLFADWGVILLDASDPELYRVAEPIYRGAIECAAELDEALIARGRELEAAGYHQQVKVTPASSLLFTLRGGARVPVHRRNDGTEERFVIDSDKDKDKEKGEISQNDLLSRISASPHDFSPSALLRPVVQDYLLPTLTYVGGSAEVAYFAQAAVVYGKLLGRITPIVPRFSATIVDAKLSGILDRFQLNLTDLFAGPESLREQLAARALPNALQASFDRANAAIQSSMAAIRESLTTLDKTLLDAADNAESKMRHQLESLQSRAARAELQKTEVLSRKAGLLSNALYPNKTLQEREIAGIYFLSRNGMQLLRDLYDSIRPDCLDHQVISL